MLVKFLHEYCDRPCKEFLLIKAKILGSIEQTIGDLNIGRGDFISNHNSIMVNVASLQITGNGYCNANYQNKTGNGTSFP